MTKSEIKAELRRSALEDRQPFYAVQYPAFDEALFFTSLGERMHLMAGNDLRAFFLLVAEAL